MKKYSALQMIGEMAKGGGAYFGQIAVEKLRAERLAQARAGIIEDREHKEDRADRRAEASFQRQKQLIDHRAKVATETVSPRSIDVVKGGDGYFYKKTLDGLVKTDVRHEAPSGPGGKDKTVSDKTLEMRMRSAASGLAEIKELMRDGYSPTGIQGGWDQAMVGGVTNFMASGKGQRFQAAAGRIKESLLRTATGAAAPESEHGAYVQMFLPAFGDSAEAMESKERAIFEHIEAMARASSSKVPPDVADAMFRESLEKAAGKYDLRSLAPRGPVDPSAPAGMSPRALRYYQQAIGEQ